MLRHTRPGKVVAACLALALSGIAVPAWATPGTSTLTGRILAASSGMPLEGWTVLVGNPYSRTVESTVKTRADGSFELSGLRPATYQLAVRNESKLYTVNGAVQLAPGQTRSVQLAVNNEQIAAPPDTDQNHKAGGTSWWSNPLVATLLVVGGAVLIGVIVDNASNDDNNDQSASPSNP